jgi:hypothetical protein
MILRLSADSRSDAWFDTARGARLMPLAPRYGIDLDDFSPLPSAKDRVDPVEWARIMRKVAERDRAILDALDDC